MSVAAREQLVQRMRTEVDMLSFTKTRIAQLRDAANDTEAALAAAQAKLDAIRSELEPLTRQDHALLKSLSDTRSLYRRLLWMDTMPQDVLRCIFEQLIDDSDEKWPDLLNGVHNHQRAAAPFALASVCSRWRKLALSMPCLWTYISVPNLQTGDEPVGISVSAIARIAESIARSKHASLDVLLRCEDCPEDAIAHLRTILMIVTSHCDRFRRFEVWLPSGIPRSPFLDGFQAPTPILTHMCVITPIHNDWQRKVRNTYFPYVPKLRHLELQGTGMSCRPLNAGLSRLVSLALWPGCSAEQCLAIMRAASSTLEHLQLGEIWANDHPPIGAPISLPRLDSLLLTTALPELQLLIVAPRLTRLTLGTDAMGVHISPLLEYLSNTVTALTLSAVWISSRAVPVLQALRNVQRLTFATSSASVEYAVSDIFFERLATISPVVWPKLRLIRFGASNSGAVLGTGLLQFVHARNLPSTAGTESPDAERPSKLVRVDMNARGIPTWLRSTIQHIIVSS